MKTCKLIFFTFLEIYLLAFAFVASAETSPDSCVTWNNTCVGETITAALSWNPLTQIDINQIRAGCALQSVTYQVTIVGLGDRSAGALTSYSWTNLTQNTSYTWKVTSYYQCASPGYSGNVATSLYSFTTPVCNSAPSANNLSVDSANSTDYCGITGYPPVRVHWQFNDPGDTQSAYQIQVFRVSDGVKVVDTDKIPDPTTLIREYVFQLAGQRLAWNAAYNWRLMVWDSKDVPSVWINGSSFTTILHAYPLPDFTHTPASPPAGVLIIFNDISICYNSLNNPYFCKSNLANRYQWDFEDNGVIDCDSNINSDCRGDATTTYSVAGNYTVRLYITDNVGTCNAIGDTPITAKKPLPQWQEVPPTIFLKRLLASALQFLKDLLIDS